MRTGREMLKADEAIAQEDQQQQQQQQHGFSRHAREHDDKASPTSPLAPTATTAAAAATAATAGGGVLGAAVGVAAGGGGAAPAAATIPMAPHRRLRQAVLLAHKLLKKEGELEVARKELADLQSRYPCVRDREQEGGRGGGRGRRRGREGARWRLDRKACYLNEVADRLASPWVSLPQNAWPTSNHVTSRIDGGHEGSARSSCVNQEQGSKVYLDAGCRSPVKLCAFSLTFSLTCSSDRPYLSSGLRRARSQQRGPTHSPRPHLLNATNHPLRRV